MKKDVLRKLMLNFKKKGVTEFRVNGFDKQIPRSVSFKGNRKSFTPDMVAIYENKRDLFSVENKILKSDLPDLIAKWILFGLEARRYGGNFYLVVDEKHSEQCQDIIKSKQLSVELLTY